MSATIKSGSDRTICNQDKQQPIMGYDSANGVLKHIKCDNFGALDVNVQDQASRAFDLNFSADVGTPTTLITDAVVGEYAVSATTGHGLVATNHILIRDPVLQRGYDGEVVSVVGNNTINLDRPLGSPFTAANSVVVQETYELDVDGTGVNRKHFYIGSPTLTAQLDITRFIFTIVTTAAPNIDEFGDLGALSRGCNMAMMNNGSITNLWNVKTNAELAGMMYDIYLLKEDKAFDANGLIGRMTYAGQSKHGVVLRIGGGEYLRFTVQDNLTDLLSFRIMAQGHAVID